MQANNIYIMYAYIIYNTTLTTCSFNLHVKHGRKTMYTQNTLKKGIYIDNSDGRYNDNEIIEKLIAIADIHFNIKNSYLDTISTRVESVPNLPLEETHNYIRDIMDGISEKVSEIDEDFYFGFGFTEPGIYGVWAIE
jgi:hypothetical protein